MPYTPAIAAWVFASVVIFAFAPARAEHAHTLGEVVVTARPIGSRDVAHIPQPVDVLSGEELQEKLASSLGETLCREPGVSASDFGLGAGRPVIQGLGGSGCACSRTALAPWTHPRSAPTNAHMPTRFTGDARYNSALGERMVAMRADGRLDEVLGLHFDALHRDTDEYESGDAHNQQRMGRPDRIPARSRSARCIWTRSRHTTWI